jgi:hypothetical protein
MTQTAQHTPAPWTYAYAPYVTQAGTELPAFEIHGEGEKVCDTVEDQPIEAQARESASNRCVFVVSSLAGIVWCQSASDRDPRSDAD